MTMRPTCLENIQDKARMKQICKHAVYVLCSTHFLNLVGECAASCCFLADLILFKTNIHFFLSLFIDGKFYLSTYKEMRL